MKFLNKILLTIFLIFLITQKSSSQNFVPQPCYNGAVLWDCLFYVNPSNSINEFKVSSSLIGVAPNPMNTRKTNGEFYKSSNNPSNARRPHSYPIVYTNSQQLINTISPNGFKPTKSPSFINRSTGF
jgi:hypothetical protein